MDAELGIKNSMNIIYIPTYHPAEFDRGTPKPKSDLRLFLYLVINKSKYFSI
jgi:hypothetical protein